MPPPPDGGSPLGPLTARHLTRRFLPPLIFVGALFAFQWHRSQEREAAGAGASALELAGETMGTTWRATVVGVKAADGPALQAAIEAELAAVVGAMSTYDPDSELSRLNRNPSPDPIPVSAPLLTVLAEAQAVSAASGGAFDVTVGPLVDAWGFGPKGRGAPPDAAALAALLPQVGWQKLSLDGAAGTVRKAHSALAVDLSAIAKGYGVDRVAQRLEALGHRRYLVEIGGELRVAGHSPRGAPWRLGVEAPLEGQRRVQAVVPLAGGALATSGDYRNYYEQDGVRQSHTLDPRTGRPIAHRLASVSVVRPDCMSADAWATALNVLGPDAGYATAVERGLAAYLLVRTDAGFEPRITPAFQALLDPGP